MSLKPYAEVMPSCPDSRLTGKILEIEDFLVKKKLYLLRFIGTTSPNYLVEQQYVVELSAEEVGIDG